MRREVDAKFPDLKVEVRDRATEIVGPLRLLERDQEIDRFQIRIVLPDDYPRGVPDVYEVGGRIPCSATHHMYADGRACLFAPGERWRHWPRGKGIVDFIDGPVRSYFIGQALFELTGEWPFGQRSHGASGILEAFGDMLRTRNPRTIVRYLGVLSRKKLRPLSQCPCGSQLPIHSCHRRKLADLRSKISYREARRALGVVIAEVERSQLQQKS